MDEDIRNTLAGQIIVDESSRKWKILGFKNRAVKDIRHDLADQIDKTVPAPCVAMELEMQ